MQVERFVIIESNTLEEAIVKALKSINLSKNQVTVEVLSENHGFMGIGSKKVKIKVSAKKEIMEELELAEILDDLEIKGEAAEYQYKPRIDNMLNGTAEIRNGKLIISNPGVGGQNALIRPGKYVRLYVNGREVLDEARVSPNDKIDIEIINDRPVADLEIYFGANNLEAYLRFIQAPGASYKVKDQPPSNLLILLAEVIELVEPKTLTHEDVLVFLNKQGITKGINHEIINTVLEQPNSKDRFLIAAGKKPEASTNVRVIYPFLENKESCEQASFEKSLRHQVEQGGVVAFKMPKVIGQNGWSVTGEVLLPDEPLEYQFIIDKGCEIIENGDKVLAKVAGRPVITKSEDKIYVSIYQTLEVAEGAQQKESLNYEGDVIVKGQLSEGCKIEAMGNIEVYSAIKSVTLRAGSNIICHDLVSNSKVNAGLKATSLCAALPYFTNIEDLLGKMLDVIDKLKNLPRFKMNDLTKQGDGPLIQLLIDSKFTELPVAVENLLAIKADYVDYLREEVLSVINLLSKMLCGAGPYNLAKTDYLHILRKAVLQVINFINSFLGGESFSIKASHIENAEFESSGSLFIEGNGSYCTTLKAGERVIITGNPGLAKGVKVESLGEIRIKELNSDPGFQSLIKGKENIKVSVGRLHPNVTIQIGSKKYLSNQIYNNFIAYINFEGELITGSE